MPMGDFTADYSDGESARGMTGAGAAGIGGVGQGERRAANERRDDGRNDGEHL